MITDGSAQKPPPPADALVRTPPVPPSSAPEAQGLQNHRLLCALQHCERDFAQLRAHDGGICSGDEAEAASLRILLEDIRGLVLQQQRQQVGGVRFLMGRRECAVSFHSGQRSKESFLAFQMLEMPPERIPGVRFEEAPDSVDRRISSGNLSLVASDTGEKGALNFATLFAFCCS